MSAAAEAATDRVGPLQAVVGWLRRVPIDDPVDRRNAPVLQVFLLLFAALPPAFWLYRVFATDIPWREGETIGVIVALSLSTLAALNVWMIRRGRLQWSVRMLLVAVALGMMLAYAGSGFGSNRFEQPIQAVWLVMAGLMIGRRALWLMYGWTVLAFAVGVGGDVGLQRHPDPLAVQAVDGLISAMVFLLIAVVVDRNVTALRESLQAATERGDALVAANARLREEIAERERVHSQLVHAQKVEAVGRLAAGVAHDFNHLLGLILGHAARGRRTADAAGKDDALEGVELAARRATAVSGKLLGFSRHDDPDPQLFDIREAVQGVQPMLRQLFDPAIRIRQVLPDEPSPVRIDPAWFDLVVLNIAANANQAMPDGGVFTIAVRHAGDAAELEFRDTGPGLSAEARERVFEPFFSSKPPGQGTGLGMSVARDLVRHAGGELTLDAAGPGAAFVIRLPLHAAT